MPETKKILLVEDDTFMLGILSERLKKSGFEVSMATDGEECMKVLEAQKSNLDIVLLDILLPKIDGFEVLRRMKVSPELSSIPVVILSNLGQKEEVQKAKDLGAEDYIIKANFTTKEIVDKLLNVLNKKN
ncbi:MAG: response regulator [Patescibacteria group bacterium]